MDGGPDTSTERDWYDEALAAGGIGLWRWDVPDKAFRFSPHVGRILGLPEGAFDGTLESYLWHVHEEDAPAFAERLATVVSSERSSSHLMRHRVRQAEGAQVRWIEVRARVSWDGRAARVAGTIHDIGRLVGLEHTTSTREAQLWAFIDALPGVALVIGEDGRYLDVFTHDEGLLARSRETLLGHTMTDVLPPEAAEFFLGVVRDVLASGTPRSVDYPLTTPGGEAWFEARIAPVPEGWAGAPAVVWIAHDITERHRAEQALRASEARYRSVVELLAEGVLVIGPDGSILASNPSAERILGFTADGLSGRSTLSLNGWVVTDALGVPMTPESFPVSRALRGEHQRAQLIGVRSPDPSVLPRWLDVNARPFRTAEGIDAALVSLTDVSEERRALEALSESERQLRSVIDNAEVMLLRLDAAGDVLFAGGRLLAKLGCAPDDVPGCLAGLLEGELREDMTRALAGEEVRAEREARGATLELVHTPVRDAGGAVSGLISVGVDVSERTRASRERERFVSELEAKNTELERFNYTVSHDLKSPLITIQGFVDLLHKDLAAERTDRVARDLEHIAKATARMQRLLDDLLDLSRAGRMQRPERTSLAEIVDEALAQVEGAVRGRGVSIRVGEGLPEVYADRTRVLQVIQNLVDNAVKHLGEQPDPRVEIGVRDDGTLYVRDNGRGVPERHHETIFGLFERLDPTIPGTGVGLALARRIVEAHGGRLWIESTGVPGEGSAFCFTLPSPRESGTEDRHP